MKGPGARLMKGVTRRQGSRPTRSALMLHNAAPAIGLLFWLDTIRARPGAGRRSNCFRQTFIQLQKCRRWRGPGPGSSMQIREGGLLLEREQVHQSLIHLYSLHTLHSAPCWACTTSCCRTALHTRLQGARLLCTLGSLARAQHPGSSSCRSRRQRQDEHCCLEQSAGRRAVPGSLAG